MLDFADHVCWISSQKYIYQQKSPERLFSPDQTQQATCLHSKGNCLPKHNPFHSVLSPVAALEAAAVLPYPAIPETQMKAIMKAGTTIQALGTKPPVQEAPLRLQSASEFTPVNQEGKQSWNVGDC